MRTSIDVLQSKNQVLCELKHYRYFNNSAFIQSREKGLITKEFIVTDTNLNIALNGIYTSVH